MLEEKSTPTFRTKHEVLNERFGDIYKQGNKYFKRTELYKSIVTSDSFREKFNGSQVIDEERDPLLLFHGTLDEIKKFVPQFENIGVHFGNIQAANYVVHGYGQETGEKVYPVFLNIKNPIELEDCNWESMLDTVKESILKSNKLTDEQFKKIKICDTGKEIQEKLLEFGYDGIKYKNREEDEGKYSYIAFSSKQIITLDQITETPLDQD